MRPRPGRGPTATLAPMNLSGDDGVTEVVSPRAGAGGRIRVLGYPAGSVSGDWVRDLPADCNTHTDAVALPLTTGSQGHRLYGAIYTEDGRLIGDSERAKTNRAWMANAEHIDPPAAVEELTGRTFFAGYNRGIFGHVLLEVLPRLWPQTDLGSYDNMLFYPTRAGRQHSQLRLPSYTKELLGALGADASRAHIVADRPLRLRDVTVSSPAFHLQLGYGPAVTSPFDRISSTFARRTSVRGGDGPRRIYLSRSRLTANSRRADNETAIEDLFRLAGFRTVHPQELAIADQVMLVRGADAVAGCDGSALHLVAFAAPGTQVLAVDSRPVLNQFLIEDFREVDAVHVLAAAAAIGHRAAHWHADLERVQAALALAELTGG